MLRLTGLRKAYGPHIALEGLDLTIEAGQVLALLGPNGAGKSTAVKCTVGLLRADAGTVEVDGIDACKHPRRTRLHMGYLPEVANVHEALTPWEYLLLKGRLFALPDDRIRETGGRLLEGFGIEGRGNEPMTGFSKGMLQKVCLAAALLTDPKVLVLDEPLSGLDVTTTLIVKELIREFARRGGAVLYCSHMLDVVESIADRIAILDEGKLLACGSNDELRRRAGKGEGTRLDEVFRSLVKASDPEAAAREILGR